MAAGKINLQANDGKVAGIVFEDGASGDVAVTVPKNGGKLAADSTVVHKTGDETVSGIKTFNSNAIFNANVGIGTSNPDYKFHVVGAGVTSTLALNGGSYKGLSIFATNTTASVDGGLKINQLSSGSIVSALELQGVDNGSGVLFYSGGNIERMRIDTSGNVLVTGSGGLGYGTRSGGTVTQLTSKSTAVTLNKPSGLIVTAADSIPANTAVSFLVNNTTFGANDSVVVTLKSDNIGSTSNYLVWAQEYTTGQFIIHVWNRTAGALAQVLGINFAIIKGATA